MKDGVRVGVVVVGGGVVVKTRARRFPAFHQYLRDVGNGGLIFMKFVSERRRKRVVMEGRD